MGLFLFNILLALAWAAVTGHFSLGNLLLGFALGFVVLAFGQRATGSATYMRRALGVLSLSMLVLRELVKSNLRIAYEVITPRMSMRPAVVAVPLDVRHDYQILVLANSITLTPGDIALDVERKGEQRVLYFYGMYVDDADEYRRDLKESFEARLLEATR